MAFIKFNKAELVNLSYSLKREILLAGKGGAYCNTSIVCCNTRRYHGLLAAPVDAFGGQVHLFLSSLDESIVLDGKQFNLGIHRYGDIYEPRGHKYIIDFDADPVPQIVYRIGEIVLSNADETVPCLPRHPRPDGGEPRGADGRLESALRQRLVPVRRFPAAVSAI